MARGANKKQPEPITPEPYDQDEALPQLETGDGGKREEEVSSAMDQFEGLADEIDLGAEAGKVVANATQWVIELFKHRPKPWDQLSQSEQRDLQSGVEHNVKELVRHVVEAIAREGRTAVRCLVVGFQDQGEDIKVTLKVKSLSADDTEQAILALHRSRGKHVLLTVASADDFAQEPASDQSKPDQPDLGFEAGSDDHPDDDSDLLKAADEPKILKHDQLTSFAGENGTVRINLAKGWVQFLSTREDAVEDNWQDMREATAEELAAERERTADFAEA